MHIIASEWGWLRYWKEPSPTAAFLTDLWIRCDALFHPQAFPSVAAVRLRWAEVEKEQVEAASTATSSSYGLLSAYWNVPPGTEQQRRPDRVPVPWQYPGIRLRLPRVPHHPHS